MEKRTKIIVFSTSGIALLLIALFLLMPRGSERTVEAPAPPREVIPLALPPLIPSTIAVTAELPIEEVKEKVESALGDFLRKPIKREDSVKGITIESHVELSPGPLEMTRAPDSTLAVQIPFTFSGWAKGSKKILGKTLQKREKFNGTATATLTLHLAFNSDWSLRPKSELDIVIQQAEMRLWGIRISIRNLFTRLVEEIVAPKLKELIVNYLSRFDVKTRVAGLWQRLHEPILVHGGVRDEPPIVLAIEPLEVFAKQLAVSEETLAISLGIKTYIHVHIGEPEMNVGVATHRPLPELQLVETLETGFHIVAPVDVAYTAIENLAKPHVEKAHNLRGIETHINTLMLYGSGTQLVAGVTFQMPAFDAKGQLYLLGTPVYDAAEMTVAVTEFNYSLTTQNLLLAFAEDVGDIRGILRTTVEEKLVFPLEERLTELQELLASVIANRQIGAYVVLHGAVDSVTPEGLYLTQDSLHVSVRLQGSLSAEVHLQSSVNRMRSHR